MKDWTIYDIESLTESNILLGQKDGEPVDLLDKLDIKGHDIYIVDFGGAFGLSALVFKNGRHIHYANDYQLHHSGMDVAELPKYYEEKLNRVLFTEDELGEAIHSYDEYRHKSNYLHSYWAMQFSHLSMFGNPEKDYTAELAAHPYLCKVCFCYVESKEICERAEKLMEQIEKAYRVFMESDDGFREAIKYELANYEAGITCDYRDALSALGCTYKELSAERQRIVREELNREIRRLDSD